MYLRDGSASRPSNILVYLRDGSASRPSNTLVYLRDGSASRPSNILVYLRDGSASRPSNILVYLRDGSASRPSNTLVYLRDGSASRPSNILVYLRDGSASRPSNTLVYLRDGSASRLVHVLPHLEVADPTFYLTQSQYTNTGPTSPSSDALTLWQGSCRRANFEVTGMTGGRSRVRIPLAPGFFRGRVIPVTLKIGTPVASLPGVWRYRVSAGTGRPCVNILSPSEVERLICSFYLSVVGRKII